MLALAGEWAPNAQEIADMVGARVFAVNATVPLCESEGVALVQSRDAMPFAPRSLAGVALDAANSSPAMVASALRALRPGGRLVVPASVALPPDVTILASDDLIVVAEKRGDLVSLGRR